MEKVKENEFKCELCGNVYDKGWSDEEAKQEYFDNFDDTNIDDCGMVCDDCYNKIRFEGKN